VKLQNAYITEANFLGNFNAIGYNMNSGTNFEYGESLASHSVALPAANSSTATWHAVAKNALNDCTAGSTWQLFAEGTTSGNSVNWDGGLAKGNGYTAGNKVNTTKGTFANECIVLTNGFKTIADNN